MVMYVCVSKYNDFIKHSMILNTIIGNFIIPQDKEIY